MTVIDQTRLTAVPPLEHIENPNQFEHLVLPGHQFNVAARRAPEHLFYAHSTQQVAEAVKFALRHGKKVSVQGTGHGGAFEVEGGVLIVTDMPHAEFVEPNGNGQRATVKVGAGTRAYQLTAEVTRRGYMWPHGSSTTVGVFGYTLGGGHGPLAGLPGFGLAAQRVVRITVVDAKGEIRDIGRDSRGRDGKLFRALLGDGLGGGKGNLAIVTEMEMEVTPLDRFLGGTMTFTADREDDLVQAWLEVTDSLKRRGNKDVYLTYDIMRFPPVEALAEMGVPPHVVANYKATVPESIRSGRPAVQVHIAASADTDLTRELAILRSAGPVEDDVQIMNPADIGLIHKDPTDPMPGYGSGMGINSHGTRALEVATQVAGCSVNGPMPMMTEFRRVQGALEGVFGTSDVIAHIVGGINPEDIPGSIAVIEAPGLAIRAAGLAGNRCTSNFGDQWGAEYLSRRQIELMNETKAVEDPANVFDQGANFGIGGYGGRTLSLA